MGEGRTCCFLFCFGVSFKAITFKASSEQSLLPQGSAGETEHLNTREIRLTRENLTRVC